MTLCVSCNKDEKPRGPMIEGLTLENFPVMDGSTSTKPLIDLAAAKLLGYKSEWVESSGDIITDLPTSSKRKNCCATKPTALFSTS